MKKLSKVFMVVAVLAMVFSFPAGAWATDGSYTQEPLASYAPTSSEITVYLSIESRKIGSAAIDRTLLPVTLDPGATPQVFKVNDALVAAMSQYSTLTFLDPAKNTVTAASDYAKFIKDTTVSSTDFGPTAPNDPYCMDGWMFRINDQFPLLNQVDWPAGWTSANGPCGASIDEAVVAAGDVIFFYHDDPTNSTTSARFTRVTVNTDYLEDGELDVNVKTSYNYFGSAPLYYWTITPFVNQAYTTVRVYPLGSATPVGGSGTTNISGNVTIYGLDDLSPGNYIAKVTPTYKTNGLLIYTGGAAVFTVE